VGDVGDGAMFNFTVLSKAFPQEVAGIVFAVSVESGGVDIHSVYKVGLSTRLSMGEKIYFSGYIIAAK
jgi:hypothetical protein